jgi:hypothetical protein
VYQYKSNSSSLHEMTRKSEHGICYGDESRVEGRGPNDGELPSRLRVKGSANHTDYTSDDDAKYARDGQPRESVECPRKRADQSRDRKDASIEHSAKLVVAERCKRNLSSEQLPTCGKYSKNDRAECKNLASHESEENVARITHCMDLRMVNLELHKQPAGVGGEDSQEDDQDHTRDDTTAYNQGHSQ